MKQDFVSADLTVGQLNAIVKKLGGKDAAMEFLRGHYTVQPWWVENDVIYFNVTSDGKTGEQWVSQFESKGIVVPELTKMRLLFNDINHVKEKIYKIAVIKGEYFSDQDRIMTKIVKEAIKRGFEIPNPEIACFIREKFSDEQIRMMGFGQANLIGQVYGLGIVTMHKKLSDFHSPFGISEGVLCTYSSTTGSSYLESNWFEPTDGWSSNTGFAFVVSK
ncbi:MAG: hypothetical protein ABIF22_01500 [bacterium]